MDYFLLADHLVSTWLTHGKDGDTIKMSFGSKNRLVIKIAAALKRADRDARKDCARIAKNFEATHWNEVEYGYSVEDDCNTGEDISEAILDSIPKERN